MLKKKKKIRHLKIFFEAVKLFKTTKKQLDAHLRTAKERRVCFIFRIWTRANICSAYLLLTAFWNIFNSH